MYGHWLTKGKVLGRKTWQGGGVWIDYLAITHITQYDLDVACFKPFNMAFKANRNVLTLANKRKGVRKENLARGWGWIWLPCHHPCHTIWPLDVACFKPFKMTFKAYRNVWTLANKRKGVKKENLARGWGWICHRTHHTIRPLDVACFKPFKMAFKAYRNVWTLANKGKGVRK
jgi:hypothetical protein